MKITYKLATLGDLQTIMSLGKMYFGLGHNQSDITLDEDWLELNIKSALLSPTNFICLALAEDPYDQVSTCIGAIWGSVQSQFHSLDPIAVEHYVFVRPDCRGIGKRLVVLFEGWAMTKGCILIQTGAHSGIDDNIPAIKMYSKLGYETRGLSFQKTLKP
jgi:GNAT superfamily N-acetyltransferase